MKRGHAGHKVLPGSIGRGTLSSSSCQARKLVSNTTFSRPRGRADPCRCRVPGSGVPGRVVSFVELHGLGKLDRGGVFVVRTGASEVASRRVLALWPTGALDPGLRVRGHPQGDEMSQGPKQGLFGLLGPRTRGDSNGSSPPFSGMFLWRDAMKDPKDLAGTGTLRLRAAVPHDWGGARRGLFLVVVTLSHASSQCFSGN
jgi:hypothetical protein